jgi:hypothetical protein
MKPKERRRASFVFGWILVGFTFFQILLMQWQSGMQPETKGGALLGLAIGLAIGIALVLATVGIGLLTDFVKLAATVLRPAKRSGTIGFFLALGLVDKKLAREETNRLLLRRLTVRLYNPLFIAALFGMVMWPIACFCYNMARLGGTPVNPVLFFWAGFGLFYILAIAFLANAVVGEAVDDGQTAAGTNPSESA